MKTPQVGYKEQVKNGTISARDAFEKLIKQAQANGGENGVAVFRGSKAANWLSRRIKGIPMGKQKLPLARK